MIFVDSGALVGYLHAEDPFHPAAAKGFAKLAASSERAFTTPLCMAETLAVLARETGDFGGVARAGMEILTWELEIVRPSAREERRALMLMESYAAHEVGYVDCLSFAVMDARGSTTAFTFDEEHFVKVRKLAPWVPIPPPPLALTSPFPR